MLLRPTQKPHDEGRLTPRLLAWRGSRAKEVPRSKTGTGQIAQLSRLSAKLVELSLQRSERDLALRGPAPNNVTPGSWPFLGTSFDAQKPTRIPLENAETSATAAGKVAVNVTARLNPQPARGTLRAWGSANFAVLCSRMAAGIRGVTSYWAGSVAIGNLRRCWQSIQKDQRFATFQAHILNRLTIAVQHTDHMRQRAVLLIGLYSRRSARTFQLLINRTAARVKILSHSKPLRRFTNAGLKLWILKARVPAVWAAINNKVDSAKKYRCPDCGGKVGFPSRAHNLIERYIFPLVLTKPVRCANCFRRDYRLIFTRMNERSTHHDEAADPIHRNAA